MTFQTTLTTCTQSKLHLTTDKEELGGLLLPFVTVTPDKLPMVLSCDVSLDEAVAGFTWGAGSAVMSKSGKQDEKDTITNVTVSKVGIYIGSHYATRDFSGTATQAM